MAQNHVSVKTLNRRQLMPSELSKVAFELYSNGDEIFYTDNEGIFYVSDNGLASYAWHIGSIEDVEAYLLWALEEEE